MFGRKKQQREQAAFQVRVDDIQSDIDEARAARERGNEAQATVTSQWPTLRSMATTIKARRDLNHFGDEFQVTFTPRGKASQ